MATASLTGTYGERSGTGTLTYSVSSTNTVTTFKATQATISSNFNGAQMWRAYIDGDYIYTSGINETVALTATKSWNRSTSAQTKKLVLEWFYTLNGKTTVFATKTVDISVPALPSYTVSYNANGGTGTTSSQTKYYGQNLTLRANGFTRTGYSFYHWNTKSDNSGTTYNASATYTGNAALALYAIWNPIISFNANGGTGAPASQTKTYNTALTLTNSKPTRTGYTFNKWNTAANGSGTDYNSGGTVAASMNTAMTLYAQWTANTYTISFNANGGANPPGSVSKTYGQSVNLPTAKPTRIGHTFLGWASSSSATTPQWLAGGLYSEAITANTILYAVWRDDYESPSITSLKAYRCGFELTQDVAIDPDKTYYSRSGTGTSEDPYIYTKVSEPDISEIDTYYEMVDNDEAGYAFVEASWSIDLTVDEGVVNTATMTGTITPEGQPAEAIAFESGYEGTSGNAVAFLYGLDVDTQYTITVTVTDIRGASAATSRTVLLLRAFYIFDFGSQGNAVGIGRAAPQSGMEVGYPATFDDIVNLYDELQFNGERVYPIVKRNGWNESSDESTLPTTPCFVLDTSTNAMYWCSGSGIVRINPIRAASDGAVLDSSNLSLTNGRIWLKGGSDAGGNANRLTTSSGMPGDMQYGQGRRGTQIYANGIAFADPFNGNSNNDGGWIRHIEETANQGTLEIAVGDDGSEPIVVRQYNTSNNVARQLTLLDANGHTSFPGLINSTFNGNTVAIGSQNASYCHFINSANIPFYFNRNVYVSGDFYKYQGPKVSYEGHTHGYLPLVGGVMTGNITLSTSFDLKQANNGTSSEQWPAILRMQDKNGYNIVFYGASVSNNGRTGVEMHVYGRNTSGSQVGHNFIDAFTDKSGNNTYSVANGANFRAAIGAAASSDRRLKSDIEPLGDDAVTFIDALEPCVYIINGERQVGLIAQDVHEADSWGTRMAFETREGIDGLDDWEKMDDGSPTWKLDYIRIIPPLVAALKNATRRIDSLEAELAELKSEMAELKGL